MRNEKKCNCAYCRGEDPLTDEQKAIMGMALMLSKLLYFEEKDITVEDHWQAAVWFARQHSTLDEMIEFCKSIEIPADLVSTAMKGGIAAFQPMKPNECAKNTDTD